MSGEAPPVDQDGLRHWQVVGGVVAAEERVLLVENLRRNGSVDWSPPGGVVDPGETSVAALTREVEEETGLRVPNWSGPVYRVKVTAPDAGFVLRVDVFASADYQGDIVLDDPDGIVTDARFVSLAEVEQQMAESPIWVGEPLVEHLHGRVSPGHRFVYRASGTRDDRTVERLG